MEKKYNSKEIIQEWIQLYIIELWSSWRIAEKYGRSSDVVQYHLKRNGVQLRSNFKLTKVEEKRCCSFYIEGKSIYKLATIFNINSTAIYNYLRKNDVKMRSASESHRQRFDEAQVKKIIKLYITGVSSCEIAIIFDCDSVVIRNYLRRNGVARRSISEALKGKMVGPKNPAYGKRGPKSSNWNGGSSKLPYAPEWTNELKLKIKERDNFTCQHSDAKCRGCLIVHHIDYDKMNCSENNLVTLCNRHNGKVNKDRKYWMQYFQLFLETVNEEKNVLCKYNAHR